MITKDFINHVSAKTEIKQRELIEKDLILQQLLKELSSDRYFSQNFVFKGGTCIIKCYLGYYRFSEDLDFSWINQEVLKNKGEKEKRRYLSNETDKILQLIANASEKLSLDFQKRKANKRYVEFGGNNKFATFKIWYASQVSNIEQFIKIQINFVELFKYNFKVCSPMAIIDAMDVKEIEFLFPENAALLTDKIKIKAYDLREILLEKFRALLTRRGLKERDFVDIYFIAKHLNAKILNYKKKIIEKTIFMLKYEKYLTNLLEKENILENFALGDKERLFLKQPEKDFDDYIKTTVIFAKDIINEIKKQMKKN